MYYQGQRNWYIIVLTIETDKLELILTGLLSSEIYGQHKRDFRNSNLQHIAVLYIMVQSRAEQCSG